MELELPDILRLRPTCEQRLQLEIRQKVVAPDSSSGFTALVLISVGESGSLFFLSSGGCESV